MTIYLLQPDGVPISAGAHRRGRAALYGGGANRAVGGRSGFRADTPSNILAVSTSSWSLQACSAMIDPGASVNQGMYGWASDATITGTPTPPDATLPRKDIYYIQVSDSSAGDGTSGTPNAPVLYLAGTPAASPVAPTLPPRSFLIATVTVPQSGGGSPTVVLNPARFAAAGASLPVYSQAERDALSLYDGLKVQRRDVTGSPDETRHGSSWYRQPVSVEHALAVSDGFFTITGGLIKTVTAGLTQVTATLQLVRKTGPITINVGDSALLLGLIPAGFRPSANHYFIATVNNAAGARYAEPQLVIGDSTNGNLVGRSTSGGPVTVDVNYTMFISTSWYI